MLAMCASLWAETYPSTSRIVLKTAGKPDTEVNFLLGASFTDAFDNAYDAVAANPGGIYVYSGGERYTTWASNHYTSGLAIGFGSGSSTSCTLHFENFSGTSYTLCDLVAFEVIEVNGSTPDYAFTIGAGEVNSTINDRFVLNLTLPTGNLETCFTGSELQITNNPIFGNIVVTRVSTKAQMAKVAFGATSIDMSSYPNDEDYLVEFGSGAKKRAFIVHVKY